MSQRSDEFHQKLIANTAVGALIFIGLCGLMIVLLPSPVTLALGILGAGLGLVALLVALGYGMLVQRLTVRGPARVERNCRVMARYGVGQDNQVLSADWFGVADHFKPYVRLYSPTGGAVEYECAIPVWEQCGEGMLGDAIVHGRWLSSFTPYGGSPQPPAGAP